MAMVAGSAHAGEQAAPQPFEQRLAEALGEREVDSRLERLWQAGSGVSQAEVPLALDAMSGLKELRERMVFQEAVLVRWGELSSHEAFGYIAGMPESQTKVNTLRKVAMSFARQDPSRAGAMAATMVPGASRNDALETVANIWAESDAAAAVVWAERLPDDFAKEQALNAIRFVWVSTDPVAAAKHVERLPPSQTTTNLIANVAFEWAEHDPRAAIAWARSLSNVGDRDEALKMAAESWANQDPNSAAAFALGLPAGEARTAAAAMVAARWARQDPRAAVEWCWRQKDPEIRTRGASAVLEVWASTDPASAGSWLDRLPPGPERDRVVLAYVEHAGMWAPDLATERALLIADEKVRARAVHEGLNRWREVDRAAAEKWTQDRQAPASTTPTTQDDAGWQELMFAAVKAQKTGELVRAEALVNDALRIAREADPRDLRVAKCQMLLGEIYRWQQNFAAAEKSLQAAVSSCEAIVGPGNPELINPLDSLANFYYQSEQYEKVLPLYQRLLQIAESDPQLNPRDVAQRARNLGTVYRLLANNSKAELYFRSAISMSEKAEPSKSDLPQHLLTLAEFYCQHGRYAEAEPLAQRAVALCKEQSGPDSLATAIALDGLGDVYLAWGQPAKAESRYARALTVTEKTVGPDHCDLAPRLVGLAASQRDQGKLPEAEANYQRAIAVVERGLGSKAPELVPILASYTLVLERLDRADLARAQRERAEEILKSSGGHAGSFAGGK